jgi:hypothetical protein
MKMLNNVQEVQVSDSLLWVNCDLLVNVEKNVERRVATEA